MTATPGKGVSLSEDWDDVEALSRQRDPEGRLRVAHRRWGGLSTTGLSIAEEVQFENSGCTNRLKRSMIREWMSRPGKNPGRLTQLDYPT